MPKKNFANDDDNKYSVIGAKTVNNTDSTNNVKDTKEQKEEYRFSAYFTGAQGRYLQEKKWRERKSITAILQELVAEDMNKHPEILDGMDELN